MAGQFRLDEFFRLRSGLDGIVPLKQVFNAIDIDDELLLMESLSMSSMTFTDAGFFLRLPWRLYERARRAIDKERTKDGR